MTKENYFFTNNHTPKAVKDPHMHTKKTPKAVTKFNNFWF